MVLPPTGTRFNTHPMAWLNLAKGVKNACMRTTSAFNPNSTQVLTLKQEERFAKQKLYDL